MTKQNETTKLSPEESITRCLQRIDDIWRNGLQERPVLVDEGNGHYTISWEKIGSKKQDSDV